MPFLDDASPLHSEVPIGDRLSPGLAPAQAIPVADFSGDGLPLDLAFLYATRAGYFLAVNVMLDWPGGPTGWPSVGHDDALWWSVIVNGTKRTQRLQVSIQAGGKGAYGGVLLDDGVLLEMRWNCVGGEEVRDEIRWSKLKIKDSRIEATGAAGRRWVVAFDLIGAPSHVAVD